MNEQEIVSKLKYRTYRHYPFFADLSLNREHILSKFTETMCVALTKDNKIVIMLNPEFLKRNTFNENMFCYLHELMHLALNHLFTTKKHSDKDEFLMNIAQDIIVNEYVREIIRPSEKLLKTLVFKEKFKELKDKDVKKMSHIEIYEILNKKFNKILNQMQIPLPFQTLPSQDNQQSQNQTSQNQDNTSSSKEQNNQNQSNDFLEKVAKDFQEKMKQFSEQLEKMKQNNEITEEEANMFKQAYKDFYFRKFFEKLSEKDKQKLSEKIKEEVMAGYTMAKQRGLEFAGMEEIIEHIFRKVRDWKKELRSEIISEIKGDWTWSKVSDTLQSLHIAGFKQIGNLPTLDNVYSIPNIYIGLDVSGSISDQDYKDFLNEIYSIFKSVMINQSEIVMWESEVTKVIKNRNGFSIKQTLEELKKRKGYGGTNLRSFLKYCSKKANSYNSIAVILTDGYVEGDLKKEEFRMFKKVIFVLSKECDYENIAKLKSPKIKVLKIRW